MPGLFAFVLVPVALRAACKDGLGFRDIEFIAFIPLTGD